jgi:hypothetical protein
MHWITTTVVTHPDGSTTSVQTRSAPCGNSAAGSPQQESSAPAAADAADAADVDAAVAAAAMESALEGRRCPAGGDRPTAVVDVGRCVWCCGMYGRMQGCSTAGAHLMAIAGRVRGGLAW